MSRERWGTFSVVDHQRPQAFIADPLLYDRLVIPVPSSEEEKNEWVDLGWHPDHLEAKLDILGDTAIRVPWDQYKREAFKTKFGMAKEAAFDIKNLVSSKENNIDPFYMTRVLLANEYLPELPKGVSKVWAMAAYPSFNTYQQDIDTQRKDDILYNQQRQEKLALILSHQFLVPDDPDKSDEDLLKQAVALSKRDDFIEHRMRFHKWQEDIIEQNITDKKAIEEIEEYLNQYNEVIKKAVNKVRWKFGFLVVNLALDFVGATLLNPLIISKAVFDVWSFMKFEKKPDIDAGDCGAAAMIYDVQKQFKWKQ